jgi:predicted Ser/Thr protein kinase
MGYSLQFTPESPTNGAQHGYARVTDPNSKLLKKDIFGAIYLRNDSTGRRIVRDASQARPWARWLARRLLAREARALAALDGTPGIPEVLHVDTDELQRRWIAGRPMQESRPTDIDYFRTAARILRRLHRQGLAHNDLAKEPNWLVRENGQPGIVDFQLAWYSPKRGRMFRLLAREDLRHLLKHKRTYCPEYLTRRERAILAKPTLLSRTWMMGGKPVYLFVTRRILGWSDREGAGDRTEF